MVDYDAFHTTGGDRSDYPADAPHYYPHDDERIGIRSYISRWVVRGNGHYHVRIRVSENPFWDGEKWRTCVDSRADESGYTLAEEFNTELKAHDWIAELRATTLPDTLYEWDEAELTQQFQYSREGD